MRLDELDYHLPRERIAQRPLEKRDASRLLALNRDTGAYEDRAFAELPSLLRGDELIVLNNARVIPARLFGRRAGVHSQPPSRSTRGEHLTGEVEVFLTRRVDAGTWEALVRPGRKLKTGERILFGRGQLEAEIIARGDLGQRTLRFQSLDASGISKHLHALGHVPLPPYIDRADDSADRERYQTVFAKREGAIAAPTAGLHFTPEILSRLRARGIEICELTLHVGLGTFQPIHSETVEEHRIHPETYEISGQSAYCINSAHAAHRPIFAIGTTVVRALEDAALRAERGNGSSGRESLAPVALEQQASARANQKCERESLVKAGQAEARIFIYPGFRFRAVDALLTNFHLPRSTLLALVSAFAGKDHVLRAYEHAVESGYRFYSYGDCMLIR